MIALESILLFVVVPLLLALAYLGLASGVGRFLRKRKEQDDAQG